MERSCGLRAQGPVGGGHTLASGALWWLEAQRGGGANSGPFLALPEVSPAPSLVEFTLRVRAWRRAGEAALCSSLRFNSRFRRPQYPPIPPHPPPPSLPPRVSDDLYMAQVITAAPGFKNSRLHS